MKWHRRWKWGDRRIYEYDHFYIIGNKEEGWAVFANKDVELRPDGSIKYDPYADYGTYSELRQAMSLVSKMETAMQRGEKAVLEYEGPVQREGAGYGSVYRSRATGGEVIAYPRGYLGRALHEWGHTYLKRKGLTKGLNTVEEEEQATRLAIHALKSKGAYTARERRDLRNALASFYKGGKSRRKARAERWIRKVEAEPPMKIPKMEPWMEEVLEMGGEVGRRRAGK